ncbi:MAG TPA: 2OG-Fe(II) oxygenase [Terricaulis sp.]|nr:2OG-Fe(II) oxygenase [Terricaulis sp.]
MSETANACGDDEALKEAARLLLGDARAAPQPGAAYQLYVRLAAQGCAAAALRAAVLAAQGIGCVADWRAALDFLTQAALLGDRGARRQLAVLANRKEARIANGEASSDAVWRGVRAGIDVDALLAAPAARIVSQSPDIRVIDGLATPAMAGWLIRAAQNRLADGEVNDAISGEVRRHTMRTAKAAPFHLLSKDLVCLAMQERAARATGVPLAHHEPPNVIAYNPGEQFQPHYDYVDPAVSHFQLELMLQGQRVATSVTYLNDDFEGAETAFPRLNWRFKGKAGDALIFFNVTPDGRVDPRTLHAGLPPSKGRKWVLSQWLRNRGQPLL